MSRLLILAAVALVALASGVVLGATLGYLGATRPTDNQQWERGYRAGYETGKHDARVDYYGPENVTLLPLTPAAGKP